MHAGENCAHQIQNAHNIPISPVYCQQQPIPHCGIPFMNIGALGQVFSCRRWVWAVILADGRVTLYSYGERCDIVFYHIFVLIYLIVFMIDYFIRKWHTKPVLIHSAFVDFFFFFFFWGGGGGGQLVSIFATWTADRLFSWLFNYFFFFVVVVGWLVGLVGRLWFILVLVYYSLDHTTHISLLGFTEHKSSADHNGWQPGCKWTSQIWNVTHCLGTLDRGQCSYTYDISQFLRKVTCFHSWIDKLLMFSIILVWQLVEKKFYKLLSTSVLSWHVQHFVAIWWPTTELQQDEFFIEF